MPFGKYSAIGDMIVQTHVFFTAQGENNKAVGRSVYVILLIFLRRLDVLSCKVEVSVGFAAENNGIFVVGIYGGPSLAPWDVYQSHTTGIS